MEVKQDVNVSIAFMKAWFSFVVVCCHFWAPENESFFPAAVLVRMKPVAVPIFMMISFYLTAHTFFEKILNTQGQQTPIPLQSAIFRQRP